MNRKSEKVTNESFLAPFRALDLTDEKGFLCGKILADLGTDVIKIEKPGGDTARKIGPFYHDVPDPEKSLYWFAYNANKRGITLDIETADGQDILRRLVRSADFLIESFPAGYLQELGLDYAALSEVNPRIIVTSITPFGQIGPYRNYQASDLTCMAMGGYLYLTGDADRAPVRISFPQAYLHGAGQAAVGTLVAHYHRELTGEGQHIDVSIQESLISATINAIPHWEFDGWILHRAGQIRVGKSGATSRQVWRCKDGFVTFFIGGGPRRAQVNRALVDWMREEGYVDDFLIQFDWEALDIATVSPELLDRIEQSVQKFLLTHTKSELHKGGLERRIYVYPVSTTGDMLDDPQYLARNFWVQVEHPELGTSITYPGPFVITPEISCQLKRRAPLIGEHNEEIYLNELHILRDKFVALQQAGVI